VNLRHLCKASLVNELIRPNQVSYVDYHLGGELGIPMRLGCTGTGTKIDLDLWDLKRSSCIGGLIRGEDTNPLAQYSLMT
jgi:hypothetical protein